MAELLKLKTGDPVRVTTPKGHGIDAMTVRVDDDLELVGLYTQDTTPPGFIILRFVDGEYRDNSGRTIKLELPIYVNARLKRMTTEDGIVELHPSHAHVGKVYRMQINSIETSEFGHDAHPGRHWYRETAIFSDESGIVGRMPTEMFDIEAN